jgi:hypothetical protein
MNAMRTIRLLVLLLGVAFFWSGVRKGSAVSRLKTEHEVLVSRARSIGVPENENYEERSSSRAPSRPSASKIPAERLKDDLVAAFLRLKALEDSADPGTRLKVEAEVREWIGRLIDLSPKELKRLTSDLTSDSTLNPKDVKQLISVIFDLSAFQQGETAAELALAHRDIEPDLTSVIGNWAKQDPSNAFAWLEKNRQTMGDGYVGALRQAIEESAARDPAMALGNLSRIEDAESRAATEVELASSLMEDGERAALLAELRLSTLAVPDRIEVLRGLGKGLVAHQDYEPGAWMKELSPDEAMVVASGLSEKSGLSPRPDAWLDWMGKSLPPERVADTAKPMLTKWINEDYEAAGEWINRQPAGDLRNEAAANYARMVAKRFPDTAKDWANSLPDGPDKRKLLEELK